MTEFKSEPISDQTEQRSKRSRLRGCLLAVLTLLLYVLSDPWMIFGLYHISPRLPDRLKSVYVVVYAPNHFLANHSKSYRELYQWYFEELQRLFPTYFDFTAFQNRNSIP